MVFAVIDYEYYPSQDMVVGKDTKIYIRFSKDMDPNYINKFTFVLNDGTSDINGKIIYVSKEKTAYFNPVSYLETLNKRQIFTLAKNEVIDRGKNVPRSRVTSVYSEADINRATDIIKEIFPELNSGL